MKGICQLYHIESDLRESHIYPKFAIDYFKKTGSPFLRKFTEPNRRMQDGPKEYLLSEKAEQEFSIREKWFAENIFIPYLEHGKTSFEYDERLYYFTMSFLWRILRTHLVHKNIINQPFTSDLHQAECEWRKFLSSYMYPLNSSGLYIFLTDRVSSHTLNVKGVDYYFSRAIDGTIVKSDDNSFLAVYGKFLRFTFWGIIKGGDESKLSQMKINPIGGILKVPQSGLEEPYFSSFFINRIKEFENLPNISEKQQQIIEDTISQNKDQFLNSDAGQAILNDIKMDSKG